MNKFFISIITNVSLLIQPLQAQSCKIVTSFSVLQDMVKTVTGDACEVIAIVGPNQDAHVFEPKPSTNAIILGADLIIINGLGFEGWMERLIQAADYRGPLIVASRYITPRLIHIPKMGDAPVPDPHAWHTVPNALLYLRAILESLSEHFPSYAQTFTENAARYMQQLEALEKEIREQLASLPEHKRLVITAHDAFSYMGDHYGIHFMSPVGISTEAEPSAKQLAALIDHIKTARIHAIFIENIANHKIIQQIAEEAGLSINSKPLYSDALSEMSGPAPTYITMMRYNINALMDAMHLNP
jgi:zinc/manganese transport system substrate-binding protein